MNVRPRLPRRRPFYGWYVVAAGAGVEFVIGAVMQQVFGAYAAALTREFGWSRGAVGLGFALSRLENGILGPAQGWLVDRFGPRMVIRAGLVLLAIGFVAFSRVHSLIEFYLAFGLMALGTGLAGFMPITVAVVNWFDRSRARALGIAQVGFAVSGLVAPFVILAITHDWRRTAVASSIAVLIFGLPMTTLIRSRPEEMGLRVDGLSAEAEATRRERDRAEQRTATSTAVDFTAREALRTRAFWLISAGHSAALLVVGAVMVHLFLHLTDSLGYSDVRAAAFVGVLTVSQIVGQLTGGFLGDRISKRVIIVTCMIMHAVALLLLAHLGRMPAMVIAFSILHGAAWGARGPLMQAMRADYFGRSSFGLIMGFSSLVTMVGLLTGPVLAGVLYDATGSYATGFTVIAILSALGSLFFVFATRPALPLRAAAEERAQAAGA